MGIRVCICRDATENTAVQVCGVVTLIAFFVVVAAVVHVCVLLVLKLSF